MQHGRFYVGLDLGQANEITALAVLERPRVELNTPTSLRRPTYALRDLRRFPLGTPYPEMFQTLLKLLSNPPLVFPDTFVVADQTSVGSTVMGMLDDTLQTKATCWLCKVTVTAGQAAGHQDGVGFCIPKKELVGAVQVLLQSRRLLVPRALPGAQLLVKELETFKMKVPLVRPDQMVDMWREGQHDDLVFAVALAAWFGEHHLPGLYDRPEPAYGRIRVW
jgi:hypothetical protein